MTNEEFIKLEELTIEWHDVPTTKTLQEYLGLDKENFFKFVYRDIDGIPMKGKK